MCRAKQGNRLNDLYELFHNHSIHMVLFTTIIYIYLSNINLKIQLLLAMVIYKGKFSNFFESWNINSLPGRHYI